MTSYRVKFFKNLVSSDGHPFKCLQRVVHVRHSRSPERAIEAAKHRFRRSEHVTDWKHHADTLETEIEHVGANGRPHAGSAIRRRKTRSERR